MATSRSSILPVSVAVACLAAATAQAAHFSPWGDAVKLDTTGGNSGSPVLDAHGKLVGLAFDGNWESVSSNWVFDPVMTRMIAVDSRYMQWIMQEVAPAPQLLKELNLAK